MEDQELRELLKNLHTEIKHTHGVDEKDRELLQHLEKDILELLERSDDRLADQPNPSSVLNVEESLYHFEATHAELSEMINRLMAVLGNAGI
jgi:hypothetical protein